LRNRGVPESYRPFRSFDTEGGAREGTGTRTASAGAALQQTELGAEVNESALWQCYQAVARYLER